MTERERVEEWERQRYGQLPSLWPELGPLPVVRVVAHGPGEVVDIPWWAVAA